MTNNAGDLPTVLIVSTDDSTTAAFVSRMQQENAAAFTAVFSGSRLQLDTKYYSAAVDIARCYPEDAQQQLQEQAPECVILLFTAAAPEPFAAAKTALDAFGTDAAEIQLCIADVKDSGSEASQAGREARAAAQLWAASQMFEYIEVDTADVAADRQLLLDGEPQGMQRVLAALQAHMWPGLHMKTISAASASTASPAASGTDSAAEGGGAPQAVQAAQHAAQQAAQPPLAGTAPQANGVVDHTAGSLEPNCIPGIPGLEDPDELNAGDRQFSQLMDQLAGTRERLQTLPDDQRRSGAEAMALQMMKMFGIDELDDSASDGSAAAEDGNVAAADADRASGTQATQ